MKFQELRQIMSANGFEKLADIARELDVSPQVVNNWKLRDQVPQKISELITKSYVTESNENSLNKDISEPQQSTNSTNHLNPYPFQYFEEDTISLWEIMAILKKYIRLILITPSILCTIAIIYVLWIAKPVYTSSATIIPANSESSTSKMAGLASQFGVALPGGGSGTKMVYPEIIKSRTLAKKMIHTPFSTAEFGQNQSLLKILTYGNEEPEFGLDTLEILAIENFIESVSVSEDIKTSIVTVSINASEPKLAADIANALIKELDIHQKQFNTEQAAKKRIFIEARIKDVNVDLIRAEEALKEFRLQNKNYQDSPSLLLEFERLLREVEVQKQLYITLKQEFEMAQIEEVEESDILYVLDQPEIPLTRSKPNRKLVVVLAGILGLGLGTMGAFVHNWYRTEKENYA